MPGFSSFIYEAEILHLRTLLTRPAGSNSSAFELVVDVSSIPRMNGNFVHLYMSVAEINKMLFLNSSSIDSHLELVGIF